jgi:hypothetical protein
VLATHADQPESEKQEGGKSAPRGAEAVRGERGVDAAGEARVGEVGAKVRVRRGAFGSGGAGTGDGGSALCAVRICSRGGRMRGHPPQMGVPPVRVEERDGGVPEIMVLNCI